jgi:hypothetical protein
MRGAIPPLHQYVFVTWCLVKHRGNFTLPFNCQPLLHNWERYGRVRALSLGVKWSGREADHLPPSSAEVNEWSYTSTPQYAFIAQFKKKHRDNFTFPISTDVTMSKNINFLIYTITFQMSYFRFYTLFWHVWSTPRRFKSSSGTIKMYFYFITLKCVTLIMLMQISCGIS